MSKLAFRLERYKLLEVVFEFQTLKVFNLNILFFCSLFSLLLVHFRVALQLYIDAVVIYESNIAIAFKNNSVTFRLCEYYRCNLTSDLVEVLTLLKSCYKVI